VHHYWELEIHHHRRRRHRRHRQLIKMEVG